MKALLVFILYGLIFFTSSSYATVYEDATTKKENWHIESNVTCSPMSVIQKDDFKTLRAKEKGLFLGGYNWDKHLRWNNSEEKHLSITFRTKDNYNFLVIVTTSDNKEKYISYWEKIDLNNTEDKIFISLDSNTSNGNWHSIKRDLEKDLGEPIVKVHGIIVRRAVVDISSVVFTKR